MRKDNPLRPKKWIYLFTIALSVCSCGRDWSKKNDLPLNAKQVLLAEEDLWTKFQHRDTEGMMAALDSDFTAFSSSMKDRLDGKDAERKHFTTFINDLDGKLIKWQMISPKVQLFSEIGLLTYRFSVTVSILKDTITYEGKQTSVWRYKNGKLYQVHYQYCYDNAPGKRE